MKADRTQENPEASRLQAAVRALVRRFSISERADVACCGMTVAQAAALGALRAEGSQRLGEIGRRLGISPSTASRNLGLLEDRGLIERVPDPQDGRASRVRLTRQGRSAAARQRRPGLRRLSPGLGAAGALSPRRRPADGGHPHFGFFVLFSSARCSPPSPD